MTTKEMIETLRYKANNIKAKIEPEFFNEVADRLEEYEKYKIALYIIIKHNQVMPAGIKLGKSHKEIIEMSKETMEKVLSMLNFEKIGEEFYGDGGPDEKGKNI